MVARQGGRIVGTVQLDLATPPNQAHRAEVAKLLVHPSARRRGIALALMTELEKIALSEGRTLLTLAVRTELRPPCTVAMLAIASSSRVPSPPPPA